jgi:hypothetical protein
MNTQKIINCIIENDLIGAKKQINEELMLRIAEAIENRKIELAGEIFEDSVCESCGCEDEDIEEAAGMADKDYDGDGNVESSKDEVWGSRLKAAAKAGKLKKKPMAAMEEVEEVEEAMMKPKGARGMAQVKRLGRTYKTGGFAKIAAKAAGKYGSAEAGKRVAGAVFHKMARAHARKG